MFLYSGGIQSVGPPKALYTSPPGRPVHSGTNSTSLRSILAKLQLRARRLISNHSHFHHFSIARYSVIQLSKLGHCGENKNAQALKLLNGSKVEPNPGSRLRVRYSNNTPK